MDRPACDCGKEGQWNRWPNGRSEFMCRECWVRHLTIIANTKIDYDNSQFLAMSRHQRKAIFLRMLWSADAMRILSGEYDGTY